MGYTRIDVRPVTGAGGRCRAWVGFLTVSVRFWPKADTRGRILNPKIGYPAVFGPLSDRFRLKADVRARQLNLPALTSTATVPGFGESL